MNSRSRRARAALQRLGSLICVSFALNALAQPLPGGGGGSASSETLDVKPRPTGTLVDNQEEHVETANGNLALRYREVHLPGPGGLNITVHRVYQLHALNADLVYALQGSHKWTQMGPGWTVAAAPSVQFRIYYGKGTNGVVKFNDDLRTTQMFCEGQTHHTPLNVLFPDGGLEEAPTASARRAITKSNWQITCDASYQMKLQSPNGVTYEIGDVRTELRYLRYAVAGSPTLDRGFSEAVLPAKRAVDVHGNWLSFEYRDFGPRLNHPHQLGPDIPACGPFAQENCEKISLLPTVITSSDGRRVDFTYDASTGRLLQLRDHSGRTWGYSYHTPDAQKSRVLETVTLPTGDIWRYTYFPGPSANDPDLNVKARSRKLQTVIYPAGGSVSFDYLPFNWQRSNSCGGTDKVQEPRVGSKRTQDGDTWIYAYAAGAVGQLDTTTVDSPVGRFTYSHMGPSFIEGGCSSSTERREHKWRVGRLMSVVDPDSNSTSYVWSRRVLTTNAVAAIGTFYVADLATQQISRNGATYLTNYTGYDQYGGPATITESGPNGGNRTTNFTYYNDVVKWVVGKRKDETFTGGSTTRTYNGNGRLQTIAVDGVATSFTYTAEGDIATKTLPRNQVYVYSNHKRGIAQTELQPESVTVYRTVDDVGNITSETDGEGRTTGFTYDGMNRVTSVTRPRGNAETIVYTATSRVRTRGPYVETTLFDGFGRPSSITRGDITVTYRHDALGRRTFESNPGATVGKTFHYDASDRLKSVTHADNSFLFNTYGAGSKTTTDERGNAVTYQYRSYGDPSVGFLMSVSAPVASANVTITRNARDRLSTVTQNNLTRTYGYNENYYLTSVINPETGTTIIGRDAAGNMTSSQVGNSAVTFYGYDGRNRQTSISYPTGTPSVTKTYTKTDRLKSVSTSVATRTYDFDANDNVLTDSLVVDNVTLATGYGYDGNDHRSSITYPRSNRVVSYFPDALGRPTQVSGYVTSVTYWPSGQFRQITYANGTVTSYGQNNRLWPASFGTSRGGLVHLDSTYAYDSVGNLLGISDTVDPSLNRTLGYDGIDRLTSAQGPWGNGTLLYGGEGNITSQALGAFSLNYAYDTQNRLSSVSGSRVATYGYDVYGNITSAGGNVYTYDAASRLRCINCADQINKIEYSYDGANRRVATTKAGVKAYEVHDTKDLQLIEYVPNQANKLTEFIYLGGIRVAQSVSP